MQRTLTLNDPCVNSKKVHNLRLAVSWGFRKVRLSAMLQRLKLCSMAESLTDKSDQVVDFHVILQALAR